MPHITAADPDASARIKRSRAAHAADCGAGSCAMAVLARCVRDLRRRVCKRSRLSALLPGTGAVGSKVQREHLHQGSAW